MRFSVFSLMVLLLGSMAAAQDFLSKSDDFFKKYVHGELVDYQSIDRVDLSELIDLVAKEAPLSVANNVDKAYLINAYNLLVIKGIKDSYPVKSPQGIPGFFTDTKHVIGGKKMSLNGLEKQILLKQTKDARLHFALVCAAKGCPPIREKAYRGEILEYQLDEQTKKALNNSDFIRVDSKNSTVKLSQIFEWYRQDFLTSHSSILKYINQYKNPTIGEDFRVSYYDYDWSLNDIDRTQPEEEQPQSNLLRFTPSRLFQKGQYEINIFNNLYSDNEKFNANSERIPSSSNNLRTNILTSTIQLTYGVSNSARVNAGVDLVLSAGAHEPNGGVLVLVGESETVKRGSALSGLGPRLKVQPFRMLPFFSYQTAFIFPVSQNLESRNEVFTALNRYIWRNQFFFDLKLNTFFRLFSEVDINYYPRRNKEEVFWEPNFVDFPISTFLNYFPNQQWSFYVNGQLFTRYGRRTNSSFGQLQNLLQVGGGVKYQLTTRLGFELSYGNFVDGAGVSGFDAGAGKVYNFGIRYIR